MKTRRMPPRFRRLTVIGVVLALAVALAVTAVTLAAGGPTKQDYLNKAQSAEATRAAGPQAPKPNPPTWPTPTLPSSCPQPPIQTGIFPAGPTPFHVEATYTNSAAAISGVGDFYDIWAGALYGDPQQGVLVVMSDDRDPCKVSRGLAPTHAGLGTFPSPYRGGALTLTQIIGDTVAFSASNGSHGSFNFVTGQYL